MKWSTHSRSGKIVILTILASAVAGGWYWYSSAAQVAGHAVVRPIRVVRGNVEVVVTSQGKLEAKQYVDVGTQVSGQLKRISVDIGDAVKQGQLLAEIDPRVFQAQVEAGEARLNSLQAQLKQRHAEAVLAEQNLKRNRNLLALHAVSRQALEETESQAAVARAQVDSIKAQIQETESNLKASRANLGFTKIYAPMAGTVTTMPAREGQTLNANQTTPTVMQIANLDVMTVRAQVAEADVSRLEVGMAAYFMTLGNSERRWTGRVRQILPTPQIVNDVVLYDVLIDVKNKDRRLMSGMTTQVFFVLGKADNALVVPAEALTRRVAEEDNEQGRAYRVSVITETGPEPRIIRVRLQTRTQAEVVEGLTEGEEIAAGRFTGSSNQTNNRQRGAARRFTRGPRL